MNLCLGICLPGLPKHEVHFCFVQIFFFFFLLPSASLKIQMTLKRSRGHLVFFPYLESTPSFKKESLGKFIAQKDEWKKWCYFNAKLFQDSVCVRACVCVCVCVQWVVVAGERRRRRVATEGGLREMPISTGNSIWQLHGDKPISMDCQGVLYELATCPLWIGMGLTSSFQTLHQTANGHMIMIFSH